MQIPRSHVMDQTPKSLKRTLDDSQEHWRTNGMDGGGEWQIQVKKSDSLVTPLLVT